MTATVSVNSYKRQILLDISGRGFGSFGAAIWMANGTVAEPAI
jgi:hypothetical protein